MWKSVLLFTFVSCSYAATLTYNWNITWVSVSPDGFRRPAIGINEHWPCPTIRGNVGDQVVVNLKNLLGNETTSLHFHGIAQIGTTEMDGPSQVSQCPIFPGENFTYSFKLDSPGTYWYHSHNQGQYPDGFRGPLIVEDPNDPYAGQFAEEIVMTISDWYHEQAPDLICEMLSPSNPNGIPPTVNSALINDSAVPAKLNFESGKTYKVRVINMAALASAMLEFDGHSMRIIEIDGVYTRVLDAQQIKISAAQRYTFLIRARPTNQTNYAFLASLDVNRDYTAPGAVYNLNATGEIIYNPSETSASPLVVNAWNPLDDTELWPLDSQSALSPVSNVLTMNFTIGTDDLGIPRAYINEKTYVTQKVPSLYTALTTGSDASNPLVYGQVNPFVVQPNQVVEIVLNNHHAAIHPFHLHGHKFQTMARPPSNSGVFNGNTSGFPSIPMQRDTVDVFANSFIVLRFLANNPGVQLFHCHIEWHVDMGLTATIVESPSALQSTLQIPTDHLDVCKAQGIPTSGNAAGNTQDLLNLTGSNIAPPNPDYGALVTSLPSAKRKIE